jgi:hypothetical protein
MGSHSRTKVLATEKLIERGRNEAALEIARKVHAARIKAARARYLDYPVMGMTQAMLDTLPLAGNLELGYLATCPLGSWFVREKDSLLPDDAITVGQVVSGTDLRRDTTQSVLSVPERGVNVYRLAVI